MSTPDNNTACDFSLGESAEELYEMAPCGYLSTTPDGKIVKVNLPLVKWIGFERDELTGGMRFLDLLTIGGRIFYETHFSLMLSMHGEANEIAFDLVCKPGGILPVLVSAIQKRDSSGTPVLNRLTIFNATERRMYERELLLARKRADENSAELMRSNAALLQANEELAQFAYAASHDLQEPLRAITSYAQLLARRYQSVLEPPAGEMISHILEGSRRMQSLVKGLLSYSQHQGSNLVLRPTDIREALENALSNLESAVEESGAIVTWDELPVLNIDAARLAQVFQNLIGNAIKYRKPTEEPRIHVHATRQDGEWVLAVKDNGLGFESRYAEQIFGVFKRLHGRDIPGTGIGLAICRKIVEAHEGRIWAQSEPGAGSTFSFTLPERPAALGATGEAE